MKGPFNRMSPSRRKFMCAAILVAGRLGILRLILHSAPHFVQPELNAEEQRISLALARQPKMMEADTAQVCASTQNGPTFHPAGVEVPRSTMPHEQPGT